MALQTVQSGYGNTQARKQSRKAPEQFAGTPFKNWLNSGPFSEDSLSEKGSKPPSPRKKDEDTQTPDAATCQEQQKEIAKLLTKQEMVI